MRSYQPKLNINTLKHLNKSSARLNRPAFSREYDSPSPGCSLENLLLGLSIYSFGCHTHWHLITRARVRSLARRLVMHRFQGFLSRLHSAVNGLIGGGEVQGHTICKTKTKKKEVFHVVLPVQSLSIFLLHLHYARRLQSANLCLQQLWFSWGTSWRSSWFSRLLQACFEHQKVQKVVKSFSRWRVSEEIVS